MSRYYQIIIDDFIDALSFCNAGNSISWNYETQRNRDMISQINANDFILSIKSTGNTAYVLRVISNTTALTVEKQCEFSTTIPNAETIPEISEISETELKQIVHNTFSWADETNETIQQLNICYETRILPEFKRNIIYFGAPGTGKSFKTEEKRVDLLRDGGSYERVTFHPDYTYANFVGTYKPVPDNDGITYQFVPGPFMRIYVDSLKDAIDNGPHSKPHLLIIEEINRANVAAVFGDVFQLLDRKNNVSEYSICASEDVKSFLVKELGGTKDDFNKIMIPDNMFIWATMNSADQGVFPMDTAFKRRWDFEYLGIDKSEEIIADYEVTIADRTIKWNDLRKAINKRLTDLKINEDKLLGPFFIKEVTLTNNEEFLEVFKNKVIMYLFEDAAKQRRDRVFNMSGENLRYSQLCNTFDRIGIKVFVREIYSIFYGEENTEQ